jgi:hypothetical protein
MMEVGSGGVARREVGVHGYRQWKIEERRWIGGGRKRGGEENK